MGIENNIGFSLQVASLFVDHHDLLDEFRHFLPNSSGKVPMHSGRNSSGNVLRRDEKSPVVPTVRQVHVDKVLIWGFFEVLIGFSYLTIFYVLYTRGKEPLFLIRIGILVLTVLIWTIKAQGKLIKNRESV